jgi:hypothetical protein
MRTPPLPNQRSENGSTLLVVLMFICVMAVAISGVHFYTMETALETANRVEFLRANAVAEAAVETVIGRISQWTTANNGFSPSIQDCATTGVPGNAAFPAITSAITFPSSSPLSSYNVGTPLVYPVLPDDTVVTSPTDPRYLPNVSQRLLISENSANSPCRFYFTHSPTLNASNVPSRSITYQITVNISAKVKTVVSSPAYTLTRYLRCDKVSPFNWCTYRMGSASYDGNTTYTGPLYIADNVSFNGTSYTDSFLYGGTANNVTGANWLGGGSGVQLKQSGLLSVIPNLVNNLAVDSNGNRQATFETSTTPLTANGPAPADMFSTREVIEPPTNPANDLTPTVIQAARIYNQADVRIQVSVTTNGSTKTVSKSVVNVNGTTVSAASNPWVTPLLAAVNVNTATAAGTAFFDRSRSTSAAIQSTDVNVGALGTVMAANPTVFPTGIVYIWDSTGLNGGTRPLTGLRLWNAGVLPSGGLEVGTNDPVYLKGDFNTGTTLPANATVNTVPVTGPASNSVGYNNVVTTEAQREVTGYTVQPAGVFGDAVIELSNNWKDANSLNTSNATSTTINLVEGWSTCSANELRPDDTYLDVAGRANPIWIENWSGARRTMSGEEFVVWHSRYCDNLNQGVGGNWQGDISYDPTVSSLKLNWGTVNFVRDRSIRD